jgi:hypothetical protein
MSASPLEAILRRDRAIIMVALGLLAILAWADLFWLSNDMAMDGMDMAGYRMVPAGEGLMMPANAPWQPVEFAYVFVMWVVMMDRHDGAVGHTDDSRPCARRPPKSGAGEAACRNCMVRRRLFAGMDNFFIRRDLRTMGA